MMKKAIAVSLMAPAAVIGLAAPSFAESGDNSKDYAQEHVPPETHKPTPPLAKTGADNTPMMLGIAGGLVLLGGATYGASKARRKETEPVA